jgi:hypothetical protein
MLTALDWQYSLWQSCGEDFEALARVGDHFLGADLARFI